MDPQESHTWILFYLISFVVLLVSVFLTSKGVLQAVTQPPKVLYPLKTQM